MISALPFEMLLGNDLVGRKRTKKLLATTRRQAQLAPERERNVVLSHAQTEVQPKPLIDDEAREHANDDEGKSVLPGNPNSALARTGSTGQRTRLPPNLTLKKNRIGHFCARLRFSVHQKKKTKS